MKSCKVLVVHDDDDVRAVLCDLLSEHQFPVEQARNGHEALEKMRAGYSPDVILSDLLMPIVNGYQLSRELKRHAAWASIPFIVLTGATVPGSALDDLETVLQAPVDADQLVSRVKCACEKKAANA